MTLIEKIEALPRWDGYKLIDEVDQEAVKLSDLRYIINEHKAECEAVACNCNTGEWQGELCGICNGTGQATPPDQSARILELEKQLEEEIIERQRLYNLLYGK